MCKSGNYFFAFRWKKLKFEDGLNITNIGMVQLRFLIITLLSEVLVQGRFIFMQCYPQDSALTHDWLSTLHAHPFLHSFQLNPQAFFRVGVLKFIVKFVDEVWGVFFYYGCIKSNAGAADIAWDRTHRVPVPGWSWHISHTDFIAGLVEIWIVDFGLVCYGKDRCGRPIMGLRLYSILLLRN